MKKIREEIGRNYHSDDTDPIPFDYDNDISASVNPSADGQWTVTVEVKSRPELSQPSRKFADELEADLYARNQVQSIKTLLKNQQEIREYVSLFLKNIL